MSIITELSNIYLSSLETAYNELAKAREEVNFLRRSMTDRDLMIEGLQKEGEEAAEIINVQRDALHQAERSVQWHPADEQPERWPVLVEWISEPSSYKFYCIAGKALPYVCERWAYIPGVSK